MAQRQQTKRNGLAISRIDGEDCIRMINQRQSGREGVVRGGRQRRQGGGEKGSAD